MFEVIKNAVNLDAHMYEINKEKLQKIYNIPTKPKREYEIIEKKVIYAKDEKKVFLSREEMERNYFSNYKYYRDYLITGFESEEIKGELQEIKHLIGTSKVLRENLMKHFEIDDDGSHSNDLNESSAKSHTGSLLMKNKFFNNFAKMCKLLQLKGNDNKNENSSVFKLYSELNNPSDVYSFAINENFLTNKLLNFKKKMTKSYYQEEFFCNFAKNYFHSNNSTLPASDAIPPEIRQKFPVDYIDSIFRPRESEGFYQLDSFMSLYGITQKANLYDKDLYENIYRILSICNYSNFMSYLYSKNILFKYIYDEFALKKSSLSGSLEDVNLSRIDSVDETDKFFRGSELLISPKNKSPNANHRRNTIRSNTNNLNIDEYLANFFLDKIAFLTEKLEDKIGEILLRDNSNINNNNIQGQFIKGSILNLLNSLLNKDFSFLLLISRNERIKITSYSDDNEASNKMAEIDEELKKIQIYKIDKKFIFEKFPGLTSSFKKEPSFKDIFSTSNCFFILEVRRFINKRNSEGSNHKYSLGASNYVFNYYIFRVTNENIERFEMAINYLKLYLKPEDRLLTPISLPTNDSFSQNNPEPVNNKPPERDVKSLKDLQEDKKNKMEEKAKKVNSGKNAPKISLNDDDDFLGISNNDILNEVLYQKHIVKKEIIGKDNANSKKGLINVDAAHEDDENHFDFRNLIDKEHQKKNEKEPATKKDTVSSSNLESSPDTFVLNQGEINYKESYMFRINNADFKFSFTDKNGQVALSYFRFSQDDEETGNRVVILMSELKDYMVAVDEKRDYHSALIQLRFNDSHKYPLEVMSYVKNDYIKFINKIDKYVKKA